ncbi:hypothetical protein BJ508DRAFT_206815, partial [Ascobolus immersus RN42]
MAYLPEKWYDSNGVRIVGPPWTADWWWEKQNSIPRGHFLIVIYAASDAGELTRYNGDKEINPLNITIGNIDAEVRLKPSRGCTKAIALFPTQLKHTSSEGEPDRLQQRIAAAEVVQHVVRDAFEELPALFHEGMKITCPDGEVRIGHPILAGWIADYMEYINLFSIPKNSCPACSVPTTELES